MRDRKYRIFHKDSGSMQYGFDLVTVSQYLNKFTDEYIEKNIVITDWIGLNDKSGNEIYEEDIFECMSGNKTVMMRGEIYFEEGCFRMKYGTQKPKKGERKDYYLSSVIENDGASNIKIIGNKFENPELIKESK